MSCECHQIGGRFIAEDPDCPAHGTAAQQEQRERDEYVEQLRSSLNDVLALAVVKYGNRDSDANIVFANAQELLK